MSRKSRWWTRWIESVADRGAGISRPNGLSDPMKRLEMNCAALLTSRGEASGVALAREVARDLAGMDEEGRLAFLHLLARRFGPDADDVLAAADRFRETRAVCDLITLQEEAEPPRQEVIRRINRAPGGTRVLVDLREVLLRHLREQPVLQAVDYDFQHLFSSWFNPGFLQLMRIDWESPASVLEKLIRYEAVHAIQGWEDLHRRLAADRRCFGFFHPALPGDPLIFVEVALVRGLARSIMPLLRPDSPVGDPTEADTALFYSISNCQTGLRGISFGNFLLKQVTGDLAMELPHLKRFATLSPVPGFARALRMEAGTEDGFSRERIAALLGDEAAAVCSAGGGRDPVEALFFLLEDPSANEKLLRAPMTRLLQAYLTRVRRKGTVADPVARFHLGNGARLEQIDPFADLSEERRRESFGMMVNYRYLADAVEENHERFVSTGEVVLSKTLAKGQRRIDAAWEADASSGQRRRHAI